MTYLVELNGGGVDQMRSATSIRQALDFVRSMGQDRTGFTVSQMVNGGRVVRSGFVHEDRTGKYLTYL